MVASFYWQLAGRIWQDIPLDENGRPTEFNRYVGYFLLKTPRFQGPLERILQHIAERTYLEAVHAGYEPRAYLRKASRKASAITRRSKPLCAVGSRLPPEWMENETGTSSSPFKACGFTLRDAVEALLLDHNERLADHVLDELARAHGYPDINKTSLVNQLHDTYMTRLRPEGGPGFFGRVQDRFEALIDAFEAWSGRLKRNRAQALRDVIRELKILPRLVSPLVFLLACSSLALISIYTGLSQVGELTQVVIACSVTIALLYAVDVLSYVVHVERDGWGDGAEAKAFQDHHLFPDEAGRWTVNRSISSTAPVVLPLLFLLAFTNPHYSVAIGGAVALMGLLFLTQTHGLAHVRDADLPAWIKKLQKHRVILRKAPHEHHHDTLNCNYGVFNGWSNPFMNAIRYPEHYTRLRMLLGGESPIWERQLADRGTATILRNETTRTSPTRATAQGEN